MVRAGILSGRAGKVRLIRSRRLAWGYDVMVDDHTSAWEVLHHMIKVLDRDGVAPAGDFLRDAIRRPDAAVDPDLVKELAFLLFGLAEKNGWTKDAIRFNTLATSWPDILEVARQAPAPASSEQVSLDFSEGDE